jgi:hypothetical protein
VNPKIGERRLYIGEPEVLYPGERATSALRVDEDEEPTLWTVEPEPGFVAAVRRLRYRLIGQWIDWIRERRQA